MILYVRSDRSAFSNSPTRKVLSIHETWRDLGLEVQYVTGGDVRGEKGSTPLAVPASAPSSTRSRKWQSLPDTSGSWTPLIHSYSEWLDLRHDRLLKPHILDQLAGRVPEMVWHRASRIHLAPMLVAKELGVPYVLEWIDRLVDYRFSLFRRKAIAADRLRMREALRVVVVSERWKQDVASEYEISPNRIIVANNAVDAGGFTRDLEAGARVRVELGIPPDSLVVGFVGSYGWQHEAHLVPEAAAIMRGSTEKPIYWLMVGDGPHRPRTDEVARDLKVEDIVLRQGLVPQGEVPHWLSAMDAAVVPSSGGEIICPIKVPEYMAASLAPIVADSAANREVVEEGRTGLLFESGDAASMANAIGKLAASPGLAAKLGAAARQEVVTRYSWSATWGRTMEMVKDAVLSEQR